MSKSSVYTLKKITINELVIFYQDYLYFLLMVGCNYIIDVFLLIYLKNPTNNIKIVNIIINKLETNLILFQLLTLATVCLMFIHNFFVSFSTKIFGPNFRHIALLYLIYQLLIFVNCLTFEMDRANRANINKLGMNEIKHDDPLYWIMYIYSFVEFLSFICACISIIIFCGICIKLFIELYNKIYDILYKNIYLKYIGSVQIQYYEKKPIQEV